MNVRQPCHIQRAEINKPLADANTRLSQAVDFDYMGSSEFEFGALPKSFRVIEANADAFVQRKVPEIMEGEACLRVWSFFSNEEFEEYKRYLLRLRDPKNHGGPMYTKESTRFDLGRMPMKYSVTDFWWDIDNHVMFGFNKNFMNRVGDYVAASLMYMNEKAAR